MKATIIYSRDKKLFYISALLPVIQIRMSTCWMTVEKYPKELAELARAEHSWLTSWLEIRPFRGKPYFRQIFPFAYYEIPIGTKTKISFFSDEFKDYAHHHGWKLGLVGTFVYRMIDLFKQRSAIQR